MKFHIVGYGCTTCIGNSGPLPTTVSTAIDGKDLVVASVLSGNRNFEGRINSEVRANYLMSPPLVVAFALAGRIDADLRTRSFRQGQRRQTCLSRRHLAHAAEVEEAWSGIHHFGRNVSQELCRGLFRRRTLARLSVPKGQTYAWEKDSTYIRQAPYFDGMTLKPSAVEDIKSARVLAVLGDSVTTDHISPAGSIKKDGPAGKYLIAHGVSPPTSTPTDRAAAITKSWCAAPSPMFACATKWSTPKVDSPATCPTAIEMSIFDASEKYHAEKVPLVILAGKEYGSGSSRDWAAKGPRLLGVRAVIAESYERIHRSNLVGMGILPLQFLPGENAESLKLTGEEIFEIAGIETWSKDSPPAARSRCM